MPCGRNKPDSLDDPGIYLEKKVNSVQWRFSWGNGKRAGELIAYI